MATLRYIAYLAQDPARLDDFYHRVLGTEDRSDLIDPLKIRGDGHLFGQLGALG